MSLGLEQNKMSPSAKDSNRLGIKKQIFMAKNEHILLQLIRLIDIPHYLGIDRRIFNKEVRPFLTEIPIGS